MDLGYFFHLVQDTIWYNYTYELFEHFDGSVEVFDKLRHSDMNFFDDLILKQASINEDKFENIKQKLMGMVNDEMLKQMIDKHFKIREVKLPLKLLEEDKVKQAYYEAIDCCENYYLQFKKI